MPTAREIVTWAPRVICLFVAAWLMLFVMDVFVGSPGYFFSSHVFSLLFNVLPVGIVLLLLALSWHRPSVGAVAYPVFAVLYFLWMVGRFRWSAPLVIAGLLLAAGILYLVDWRVFHRHRHHRGSGNPRPLPG
ncbi:MAG: hypothetical protein R6X12_02735 [bacterium]